MTALARFARWLVGLRFTVATITVTVTRDPACPAERDLPETAHDHNLDARHLLLALADVPPGLRLGPSGGGKGQPRRSPAVSQPISAPKPPTANVAEPLQINPFEVRDDG